MATSFLLKNLSAASRFCLGIWLRHFFSVKKSGAHQPFFSARFATFFVAFLDCFITINLIYFNRIFTNLLRAACNLSIFS